MRPLEQEDFEDLYAAAADPLIWEQHPDRFRYQRDVFQRYFDSGIACRGCLIVEDHSTGEIIGSSRFYDYSANQEIVTVGYTFLKRKYWGGSFNRELKHLMLRHAFMFVEAVLFDVGGENIRSQKALAKIGAKLIGTKEKVGPGGKQLVALTFELKKQNFVGLF